ncbi:MAG: glycosyltransferase family 2 protein [Syntrophales bacterium LBB04]|nr:glycosyltransferase family 2 protein [Syntrophales bacterium LBB04]
MDISIIIVNWNTKELLRNCLLSIEKTVQGIAYEIIVVDNASEDGSRSMLKDEFPAALVIENQTNKGFAAANNQALTIMSGRYALLLNTDAVLTEKAIPLLYAFMEKHPAAAMACGQLLNADGSRQNSIATFPNLLTLATNTALLEYVLPRLYPSKRYVWKEPVEIDSGVGACLVVRKKAIDEIGMLDERYFFFFEETDWAYRMRAAGWKIFHIPDAFIYHLQGQSIGRDVRSRIEFYRSRYQFFQKWRTRPYFMLVCMVIFFRLLANWFFTFLATILTLGQKKSLRDKWVVYMQLLCWHFQGCPGRLPSRLRHAAV